MNKRKNKFISFIASKKLWVIALLCFFYAVALFRIIVPGYPDVFVYTPIMLIGSFAILMFYRHKTFALTEILVYAIIFITSYFIEVWGVNTGLIFGNYTYGANLGIKWLNTPLLIGLNWVLLVYLSSAITSRLNMGTIAGIIAPASLMLLFDIVLEQVAPLMGLWFWQHNQVPLTNYFHWFLIALAFQAMIKLCRIDSRNNLALPVYSLQIIFFVLVYIFKTC